MGSIAMATEGKHTEIIAVALINLIFKDISSTFFAVLT